MPACDGEPRVQLLGRRPGAEEGEQAAGLAARRCRARRRPRSASSPEQPGGDQGGGEHPGDHGRVQAAGVEAVRRGGGDPADRLVADHGRGSTSRPSRRAAAPTASAAGSTTAVACTSPPAWVSSKSSACTRVPFASAAAGARQRLAGAEDRRLGRARRARGPPSSRASPAPVRTARRARCRTRRAGAGRRPGATGSGTSTCAERPDRQLPCDHRVDPPPRRRAPSPGSPNAPCAVSSATVASS